MDEEAELPHRHVHQQDGEEELPRRIDLPLPQDLPRQHDREVELLRRPDLLHQHVPQHRHQTGPAHTVEVVVRWVEATVVVVPEVAAVGAEDGNAFTEFH